MPFGAVTQRLGIANVVGQNAYGFGRNVLRLPAGFPVYQQQLVHSNQNFEGPAKAAAEWCGGADDEYNNFILVSMKQIRSLMQQTVPPQMERILSNVTSGA
jgi:hypothetical protein